MAKGAAYWTDGFLPLTMRSTVVPAPSLTRPAGSRGSRTAPHRSAGSSPGLYAGVDSASSALSSVNSAGTGKGVSSAGTDKSCTTIPRSCQSVRGLCFIICFMPGASPHLDSTPRYTSHPEIDNPCLLPGMDCRNINTNDYLCRVLSRVTSRRRTKACVMPSNICAP